MAQLHCMGDAPSVYVSAVCAAEIDQLEFTLALRLDEGVSAGDFAVGYWNGIVRRALDGAAPAQIMALPVRKAQPGLEEVGAHALINTYSDKRRPSIQEPCLKIAPCKLT